MSCVCVGGTMPCEQRPRGGLWNEPKFGQLVTYGVSNSLSLSLSPHPRGIQLQVIG